MRGFAFYISKFLFINTVVFQIVVLFSFAPCAINNAVGAGNNIGAIIISGYKGIAFSKSVDLYKEALMNSDTGPGIPENNIYTYKNASLSDLQDIIQQVNADPSIDTVYYYHCTHGFPNGVIRPGSENNHNYPPPPSRFALSSFSSLENSFLIAL